MKTLLGLAGLVLALFCVYWLLSEGLSVGDNAKYRIVKVQSEHGTWYRVDRNCWVLWFRANPYLYDVSLDDAKRTVQRFVEHDTFVQPPDTIVTVYYNAWMDTPEFRRIEDSCIQARSRVGEGTNR